MKTSMGLGLSVVLMWLTPLVEASERFERSLMITSRAALERDGAAQLGELVLEPEINLRFTDNVSVTAITRTRLDLANRLEPGQPSNRNRSQPSSRVFWGDETDTEEGQGDHHEPSTVPGMREEYPELDHGEEKQSQKAISSGDSFRSQPPY